MYLSNLIGIEDFVLLDSLIVDQANLDSADFSNNLMLRSLKLSSVRSLDLTNNNALELIDIVLASPTFSTSLNINGLTNLEILQIQGLTGSLDVSTNANLWHLSLLYSQIISLNVMGAASLEYLDCSNNQLTNLDVSQAPALKMLKCDNNELVTLNLSSSIETLDCTNNKLTSLDLSMCVQYSGGLWCEDNELTSLDLRTGTNMNMYPHAHNNFLQCVSVDSVDWSYINWPLVGPVSCFDPNVVFSANCSTSAIQEQITNKELLKVTDLLGRETKGTKNELLFYIYNDGTVEKKIIIE